MKDGPILLIGDDDWEAIDRLAAVMHPCFYILLAKNAEAVLRMARKFKPAVTLLGEGLPYGKLGADALVAELSMKMGLKVIVLTEGKDERPPASWREAGASDALPHPTKYARRLLILERRIFELAHVEATRAEGT
jgi:DNA-binding response OmpR family regulator